MKKKYLTNSVLIIWTSTSGRSSGRFGAVKSQDQHLILMTRRSQLLGNIMSEVLQLGLSYYAPRSRSSCFLQISRCSKRNGIIACAVSIEVED